MAIALSCWSSEIMTTLFNIIEIAPFHLLPRSSKFLTIEKTNHATPFDGAQGDTKSYSCRAYRSMMYYCCTISKPVQNVL